MTLRSPETIPDINTRRPSSATEPLRCHEKFLRFFPEGFRDEKYGAWERNYKWAAHLEWEWVLDRKTFQRLLREKQFAEIAQRAVRVESRTNLLFSFEKMALRDAVRGKRGAEAFARGLFDLLHGRAKLAVRFKRWVAAVGALPRKQTRVLTWPVLTVFGFIARPEEFIFLKPKVTQEAAAEYGFLFDYNSKPCWETYESLLEFSNQVRDDLQDLGPRDQIDIQSFLWVQGSEEYAE